MKPVSRRTLDWIYSVVPGPEEEPALPVTVGVDGVSR
ncbi:SMIM27 isoform 3, partial [Pan troglodytes]